MKQGIGILLMLAVALSSGCAYSKSHFDNYWGNRGRDFADIFIAELHWGYGGGFEAQLTSFFGVLAGYGNISSSPNRLGEIWSNETFDFDNATVLGDKNEYVGFLLLGSFGDSPSLGFGGTRAIYVGPINVLGFIKIIDLEDTQRCLDISLFIHIAKPGFRIGISPGEAIDFLLGWFFIDFADDDEPSLPGLN